MPFNPDPQTWLPGISTTPDTLNLPLTSFPELAPDEVTGTGKDFRKIYWALIDGLHDLIVEKPQADRPIKVTVRRSTNELGNRLIRNYSFTFELTKTGIDVSPE